MDKSDVEMEDTENHPHDSGTYVKESDKNATAGAEDAEECENGEEDSCESEVSDDATSGIESQIHPNNEVNEPMNAEGSFEGQINSERKSDLGESSSSEASLSLKCNNDGNTVNTTSTQSMLPPMAEDDDGTPEEQATFLKELESFRRERAVEFKFFNRVYIYGKQLNILKFWRVVIRLGGYDRVTKYKLWSKVGPSVLPPETLRATILWALECFYKKYVLEYERHKTQSGELQLPEPEVSGVDSEGNGHQGSGSEMARRDAASRSMPSSYVNPSSHSEARELVMMDKSSRKVTARKSIKFIVKQKTPIDADPLNNAARTETSTEQLLTPVLDVGPSADWVKINVRKTRDSFQVYGLVPGLAPNEIRVQSDPAGRLVIIGKPQQSEKLWGVVPFHKIVVFPARIDPSKTRAYVNMHGRLYVGAPFEQSKKKSR